MSRTLEKEEFIRLLKEVSTKLDQNGIRNDIPFCHKDKMRYNFIKILIPQEIDATNLCEILSSNDYRLKGQFIDFLYKDFRFIFIRTSDNEFLSTFFYYSWDILPTLMNVMLNKFGLDLLPSGLRYIGGEKTFVVSNKLKHIIEFLDLDSNIYFINGFTNVFNYASFISSSKFFNPVIFNEYHLDENDYFYFDKKKQYDECVELFNQFKKISFQGYEFTNNLDEHILYIDQMFPGSEFLENVAKLKSGL